MTADTIPITDEQLIYVLLSGEQAPSEQEVVEFILDGVYFVPDPQFLPSSRKFDDRPLSCLQVIWDAQRPPVVLELLDTERVTPIVGEAQSLLGRLADDHAVSVDVERTRTAIYDTKQAIAITLDTETMTEESWAMLDSLEAYLARSHAGLVYVKNEGFYDSSLQPIVRRPPK